jgi:hypothetical protein
MTEAEWLACENPAPMLEFLRGRASERKLRLFAVARCRLFRPHWSDRWPTREAVDAAEQLSDGLIQPEQLARFRRADEEFGSEVQMNFDDPWAGHTSLGPECLSLLLVQKVSSPSAYSAARGVLHDDLLSCSLRPLGEGKHERLVECLLLRDLFGHLFRPSTAVPSTVLAWNDGTVRRIAEGIYDERAFERLPILADALLDARCDDEGLIAHCRSAGTHLRGCWPVDLLLGRE